MLIGRPFGRVLVVLPLLIAPHWHLLWEYILNKSEPKVNFRILFDMEAMYMSPYCYNIFSIQSPPLAHCQPPVGWWSFRVFRHP